MRALSMLVLLGLVGCEAEMGEALATGGATFEVQSFAPRCLEAACGLDRPLLVGAGIDVIATLAHPTPDAVRADSSDASVLVVESTSALADTAEDGEPLDRVPAVLISLRGVGAGTATLRLLQGSRAIASTRVHVQDAASVTIELGPGVPRDPSGAVEMIPADVAPYSADGTARDGGPIYVGDAVQWRVEDVAVATLATDEGDAPSSTGPTLSVVATGPGETRLIATAGSANAGVPVRVVAP